MPKLCIVSDIHHGRDLLPKRGTAAAGLMAKFAEFCNETQPDAVIDLGDRITDVDHAGDLALMQEAAALFAPIEAPVLHLTGNHDRDHLSVAENAEILGQPMESHTRDIGAWRLVLWHADARFGRPGGFSLPEPDLLWLAGVISGADRPLCIFSHVPVSGASMTGNYYFENTPASATYAEASRVREVLGTARVPVLWLSGHVHWNTVTRVGGHLHLTQQSLTESSTTDPDPAGAWSVLDLDDTVRWTVHGGDPLTVEIPTDRLGQRWMTPRPARNVP